MIRIIYSQLSGRETDREEEVLEGDLLRVRNRTGSGTASLPEEHNESQDQ